jgi:hypothetical protein
MLRSAANRLLQQFWQALKDRTADAKKSRQFYLLARGAISSFGMLTGQDQPEIWNRRDRIHYA